MAREYYLQHREKLKAKQRIRNRKYREQDKEKVNAAGRVIYKRYYKRNHTKILARRRNARLKNPLEHKQRQRASFLKRAYGLSVQEYDQRVADQNGLCAICKRPPQKRKVKRGVAKRLCVDHDHNTNKVRSLLCANCNLVVGHIENNIELVPIMFQYLSNYRVTA